MSVLCLLLTNLICKMENTFNIFFYGFTQSENKLLVLCQNGHVVEVHCPDLNAQKSTKTYKLSELPSRSFRFRSIKSQIKVCAWDFLGLVWEFLLYVFELLLMPLLWQVFFVFYLVVYLVYGIFRLYLLLVIESIVTILVKSPLQFQTVCLCKYFRETWKLRDVKL